ncbi:hypothetical protein ACQCVP_22650 [Rossellomorea vietnamensis]|uniref:hypothetical protein n=1 Tax=Rossellomorea vietnamensis TaxID=218284 RepID=UPI003CF1C720
MATKQETRKVYELPYYERQFIVINEKVEEATSLNSFMEQLSNLSPLSYLNNASIVRFLLSLGFRNLGAVTGIIAAFGIGLGIKELMRFKGIDHNILVISPKEVETLDFPPGHPRKGVFYVAHPVDQKRYYTVAQFHRLTFEHKFAEAISLLMSLGAKTIDVEHIKGWKKEFNSSISAHIPSEVGDVNIAGSLGANKTKSQSLLFKATLNGSSTPKLPDELVWYHHEPAWKQLANGRINHGMKDFSLTVNYEDDYGVNSKLEATISSAKFQTGGDFIAHKDTVWKIEGTF